MSTPPADTGIALAATLRAERGRCLATLAHHLGDIDLAEDALAEATTRALERWPVDGVPHRPGAWLTTVARRHAIDVLRRRARGRAVDEALAHAGPATSDPPDEQVVEPVDDDQLRLLFTCCHPALSRAAQVALTLRLLAGLDTGLVAEAFLVAEPTMAQRISRAKRKVREAHIPLRVPEEHELPDRLAAVLRVVYLTYNAEGAELRVEAIRLARLLRALMPDESEVTGLLALLLLTEARWPARRDDAGRLVLLRDQDRSRWDPALVAEGHDLVRACLRRDRPGPYQVQAAINAVHTDAPRFEDTDWPQVVALYDQLLAMAPSPVVALNRAVAIGELAGARAALALVDDLDLGGYQPFHASRADLLRRIGHTTRHARSTDALPTSRGTQPCATTSSRLLSGWGPRRARRPHTWGSRRTRRSPGVPAPARSHATAADGSGSTGPSWRRSRPRRRPCGS